MRVLEVLLRMGFLLAVVAFPFKTDAMTISSLDQCNRVTFKSYNVASVESNYSVPQTGMVMFEDLASVEGSTMKETVFLDCVSGRHLKVQTLSSIFNLDPSLGDIGLKSGTDSTAMVAAEISKAVDSKETFSLNDLAEVFVAKGLRANVETANDENCGCAFIAPQALGKKKKFKLEAVDQ